jgi:hypothetical protein
METGERPLKYRREYEINKCPQPQMPSNVGQAQDFL